MQETKQITDLVTIYRGDCMDYMKGIPDKHFDLAIVDPPYGISINMNMGRKKGQQPKHQKKNWDDSTPGPEYFQELFRVSKNQIIWGGNYYALPQTKSWIFWDKMVPAGVSFADGELAWSSLGHVLRIIKLEYSGFMGSESTKIHPIQKPIRLYREILARFATPGQTILDTHLGSGSSAIAAHYMGNPFVGIELDQDYFQGAAKRIENETRQLAFA